MFGIISKVNLERVEIRDHSALCVLLVFALLLISPKAWGHQEDKLEEIIVEGRWDKPTGYLTSASQGIVGQAEIEIRPFLRTGEILEVVPGLVVTQHSGSGKSNQIFLRGFNLDHGTDFASWIDGMPINMPSHGHGQGYTDLNFLIPELINNIEFMKGPYHAEVTDFSSAGAAYFNTMRELDRGIFKTSIGKDDHLKFLLANSTEFDFGTLLYGIQTHNYDGPWVGVEEDLEAYSGLLKLSGGDDDITEWSVTFMGYDTTWDSADQVPRRAVESGIVDALGTIDDTVGGASSRYSLSAYWHRDFGNSNLKTSAYHIDYGLNLFSNFTYFLDDPINGDQFEQVDDRTINGGEIVWSTQGNSRWSHTVGLSVRSDSIDEVGLFRTAQRNRLSTVRQDQISQLSAGAYYELSTSWNPSWQLDLGARLDYFDFDVEESNLVANQGNTSATEFSPKLNLIYRANDSVEFYLSAGQAYHTNDARGTTITIDPVSLEPIDSVDPVVKSMGSEIGFRWFIQDTVNFSSSLWYLELDSELLFVGDAGNTEASRPSKRYGIEFPIYYRPNPTWTFDMELALSHAEYDDNLPGSNVPGAIDTVVSAGVYANFESGFYGNLRTRYFGERPLTEENDPQSGASTSVNLSAGYKSESFDARVNILNLLDSDDDDITYFYESRLPGEGPDGVLDQHFHPIEPRTVRLELTWFF